MYVCVHTRAGVQMPEEGDEAPAAGVIGDCKPGIKLRSSEKAANALNCGASSSSSHLSFCLSAHAGIWRLVILI